MSVRPFACVKSCGRRPRPKQLENRGKMVVFHLTGFGKFNGVPENPTSWLMQFLPVYLSQQKTWEDDDVQVASFTTLEVSAQGSTEQLRTIHNSGTLAAAGGDTVYFHCGVDAKAETFRLESRAHNLIDFRVPDERGEQPSGLCVVEGDDLPYRDTDLLVNDLVSSLKEKGWLGNVVPSLDPGRFVCNHTYYISLAHCQSPTELNNKKHAIFLHVPPFSVINADDQLKFIRDCIEQISQLLVDRKDQSGNNSCPTSPSSLVSITRRDTDHSTHRGEKEDGTLQSSYQDFSSNASNLVEGAGARTEDRTLGSYYHAFTTRAAKAELKSSPVEEGGVFIQVGASDADADGSGSVSTASPDALGASPSCLSLEDVLNDHESFPCGTSNSNPITSPHSSCYPGDAFGYPSQLSVTEVPLEIQGPSTPLKELLDMPIATSMSSRDSVKDKGKEESSSCARESFTLTPSSNAVKAGPMTELEKVLNMSIHAG